LSHAFARGGLRQRPRETRSQRETRNIRAGVKRATGEKWSLPRAAATCVTLLQHPPVPVPRPRKAACSAGINPTLYRSDISSTEGGAVPRHIGTVYVANLPWRTTEDDLASLFRQFGRVVDVRVIQDPATGRSRGYGFVELADPESVRQAVVALDGHEYRGRRLVVSPARPKRPRH
jgi:hypothetical protein